MAALNPYGRTT